MSVLFRLIELSSGTVHIDGVDISKMGLRRLRNGLSIIPQEALLFSGTVRSNLDPFSQHDDAQLWDALRRAHLVTSADVSAIGGTTNDANTENDAGGDEKQTLVQTSSRTFTLDTSIDAEGANLSAGQRSLLSLARALCKDSHIVLMDEATARYDKTSR